MIVYNEGQKSKQGHTVVQGVCPVCNQGDLDYDTIQLSDNAVYYPWTCENCKSEGEEWYNLEFTGQNIKE